jgi:hypothetical protein
MQKLSTAWHQVGRSVQGTSQAQPRSQPSQASDAKLSGTGYACEIQLELRRLFCQAAALMERI